MESSPSVLAKVMGLDETPPQLPVQKQRVLSENYQRRVASIGVREKHYSFRLKVDQKELKDDFEVADTLDAAKHDNLSVEKGKTNSGLSEAKMQFTRLNVSPEMMDYEDDDFFQCLRGDNSLISKDLFNLQVSPSNSQCTSGSGNVDLCRKSRRKYEQVEIGTAAESLGKFGDCNSTTLSKSQFEPQKEGCFPGTRIVGFKPKQGKVESSPRYSPSLSSLDTNGMEFSSPGSRRTHLEVKQRQNLESDMELVRLMSTVSRKPMGKNSRNTRCSKTSIGGKISRLGFRGGNSIAMESELIRHSVSRSQSFPYSDESCIAREAEENFSERWKMPKRFQEVGMVGRHISLGNLRSLPPNQTGTRKLDYRLGRQFPTNRKLVRHDLLKDLDLSKCRTQQDKYAALCKEWNIRPKGSVNWGNFKLRECKLNQNDDLSPLNLRSNCKRLRSFPGVESKDNHTTDKTSRTSKKKLFGNRACISVDTSGNSSSHLTDASVQQEISSELSTESPFLLHCSTTEPDCMMKLEEAYEPSPVSVLEPLFRGARSPIPDFLQRINVDINDFSDTYSEGSEMVVSSDDDSTEESAGIYKENEDLMRFSRVEGSRDFSYLVDVLSEINFYGRNSEMDFGASESPEWPLSISVFETLEKKFGDQVSWKRSDRRLLFDRINAGLMESLEPWMGAPAWRKPVSRRIRSTPGEEMIEEDLWMLLVNQEKEIRKDLTEKVLGSEIELDLSDDIDGIGREIERFLMDELVMEFVSLESF